MGLYSTNRVVQLATSNMNESSNIDFEHIDTDESAPNLLESSIMLHEADQQMFDTLIGLDFVEAHNEQAMLEDSNANDDGNPKDAAVSKNIFQKIVDIIQKAIEVVKNAIKTAINKVREFANNTANKVVAVRLKKYDWSKFKEFKVKYNTSNRLDYFSDDTIKAITKLKTFISSADVDNASAEDLEAKIKEITDEIKSINYNHTLDNIRNKRNKEYNVNVYTAKSALKIISTADKTISNLNKVGNEATMALLKLKQRVGKPKKDDAKSANSLYSFATKASEAVTKLVQIAINDHIASLKVARDIVLKTSKIAIEEAKGSDNAKANTTNNNESAYDSFVGSISDIYVENYFADLFD